MYGIILALVLVVDGAVYLYSQT